MHLAQCKGKMMKLYHHIIKFRKDYAMTCCRRAGLQSVLNDGSWIEALQNLRRAHIFLFPLIFESNKGCLQCKWLLEFKYTSDRTNARTEQFFRLTVFAILVAIFLYRVLLQARHKARVLEKQKTATFTLEKAITFPTGTRCPSTKQLFCSVLQRTLPRLFVSAN